MLLVRYSGLCRLSLQLVTVTVTLRGTSDKCLEAQSETLEQVRPEKNNLLRGKVRDITFLQVG